MPTAGKEEKKKNKPKKGRCLYPFTLGTQGNTTGTRSAAFKRKDAVFVSDGSTVVKSWVPVSPPPSVSPVEGWEPLRLPDRPPPPPAPQARPGAGPGRPSPFPSLTAAPLRHLTGALRCGPLRAGVAPVLSSQPLSRGTGSLPWRRRRWRGGAGLLSPSLPTHNHLRPGPGVAARVAELRGRAGGRGGCGGVGRRWLGARRLSLGGVSAGWLRLSPAPPPAHAQT